MHLCWPVSGRNFFANSMSATDLLLHGYTVLPAPPGFDAAATVAQWHATMAAMPEFLPSVPHDAPRAFGGFGCLANPSSYHNPLVRQLRMDAWHRCRPLFEALVDLPPHWVMAMDRMMFRPAGTAPAGGTWHRDLTPVPGALNFGGWINLGPQPQHFLCIPGSHSNTACATAGFTPVKGKVDEASTTQVRIDPGCQLVFNSSLVHKVLNKKVPHHQYRLFINFRLQPNVSSADEVDAILTQQGVPPLPTGGAPPMFSPRHPQEAVARFYKDTLLSTIPQTPTMPSLAALGLPLYPPYTAAERACLLSTKLH